MASPDSSTRSAARATFSALRRGPTLPRPLPRPLERLPIRWRLAVTSALLTLVILLGFALVVGLVTGAGIGIAAAAGGARPPVVDTDLPDPALVT